MIEINNYSTGTRSYWNVKKKKYTVKAVIDGKEYSREFSTSDEAQEFQERLVFVYGVDAEVQ